uniref:Uncharacterized protein n=1 Tax=uncultured marine virus TaxID=186617 RepID=A0A0F7L4C1_9VIRU|nr:hypothetical protein [uncultured marine virus]
MMKMMGRQVYHTQLVMILHNQLHFFNYQIFYLMEMGILMFRDICNYLIHHQLHL